MELEETNPVNKAHVKKRVKDWKKRVSGLYKTIEAWLAETPDYAIVAGHPMKMYEELMQQFGIQPEDVETADLFKNSKLELTFKPKGLWIIGANGRVDIISRNGNYMLVDYSDQFQDPKWHIYTTQDRQNGRPFTKTELLNILNA
jgi:hypothetical protein